jgi:hypothetical protein
LSSSRSLSSRLPVFPVGKKDEGKTKIDLTEHKGYMLLREPGLELSSHLAGPSTELLAACWLRSLSTSAASVLGTSKTLRSWRVSTSRRCFCFTRSRRRSAGACPLAVRLSGAFHIQSFNVHHVSQPVRREAQHVRPAEPVAQSGGARALGLWQHRQAAPLQLQTRFSAAAHRCVRCRLLACICVPSCAAANSPTRFHLCC